MPRYSGRKYGACAAYYQRLRAAIDTSLGASYMP
jgi:hypothetical protein